MNAQEMNAADSFQSNHDAVETFLATLARSSPREIRERLHANDLSRIEQAIARRVGTNCEIALMRWSVRLRRANEECRIPIPASLFDLCQQFEDGTGR